MGNTPKNNYDLAQALFHECGGRNIDELIDWRTPCGWEVRKWSDVLAVTD